MSDTPAAIKTCARCGAPLAGAALGGHCPRCLMETSFGGSPVDAWEEEPAMERLPRVFGGYELVAELGRGGMGVVYRARQISLKRDVAVKVLPGGEFARPEFRKRFRAEAFTAAQLHHPNIVTIHEVGEHEGLPFFVMELVEGRTLAETIRERSIPPTKCAEYLSALAGAVHFAHEKGVLHRDLKPSNVLLDPFDTPRLTDFGLARTLAHETDVTLSGQALGSPAYMPPEQALGKAKASQPASDVYSLGAILYHLLTGRPPFQGETIPQILRQVQEDEPVAPKRLNPAIPADLETICLKCLHKDANHRYPTAGALQDDLARFLRREPIRARPVGPASKLWLWCRRRPAVAALSAGLMVLLIVLAVGTAFAGRRIMSARRAENQERQNAVMANAGLRSANGRLAQTVNILELQRAEDFFRNHDAALGVAHLAAILRHDPANEIAANRLVSALVHRDWVLRSAPPINHGAPVRTATFSPDGGQVLTVGVDGSALVSDAVTSKLLFSLDARDGKGLIETAKYSPDGRLILTISSGGTAQLWRTANLQAAPRFLSHAAAVRAAEFSHDGTEILTASADGSVKVWDAETAQKKEEYLDDERGTVQAIFAPDSRRILTTTPRGRVCLWNRNSGRTSVLLKSNAIAINNIAFSRDGEKIAVACDGGLVLLWPQLKEGAKPIRLAHQVWAPVWHLSFSPDNRFLLTTGEDTVARLWDSANGFPVGGPLQHEGRVVFGGFSPDGKLIVTTSSDVSARLWHSESRIPFGQPLRHSEPVKYASFSGDGRRLVTASVDATAQIWEVASGQVRAMEFRGGHAITSVKFNSRNGTLFATSLDGRSYNWDALNGTRGDWMRHSRPVLSGDISRDGRFAVTGCDNGSVCLWDIAHQRLLTNLFSHSGAIVSVQFSPGGETFVTASADGSARVWNTQTLEAVTPALRHAGALNMASFSPDGRRVVSVSQDKTGRIWNASTGSAEGAPLEHRDDVLWADFSPDGTRVVTASTDNTARIWDVPTGLSVTPPLQHARIVSRALFSPDGRRVVTVSQDRAARVWDASTGKALTPPMRHETAGSHVAFSPDGQRLVTGGWNGLIRVWDTDTGQPLTEWLSAGGKLTDLCFDGTGSRVATASDTGVVHVWELPMLPSTVPPWFLTFVEGVAGLRLSERGNVELIPRPELEALARAETEPGQDEFWERLRAWFLTNPSQRLASPFQDNRRISKVSL